MDDEQTRKDNPQNGKVLTFPDGKNVLVEDIGAPYVIGQGISVSAAEPVDPTSVAEDLRNRASFVRRQELVRVFERGGDTEEAIDVILKEIAEESAHIKYDRRKNAQEGKSTAGLSLARVQTLSRLVETLLKRKESIVHEKFDLKSPRFQKIFHSLMGFFYTSMEKCSIEPQDIDLVFKQMKADMADWEKKIDSGDY